MILHHWGNIDYVQAREKMNDVHSQACKNGENHLIFCEHAPVFTVGENDNNAWPVPVVQSDRGGSISCHSPGQLVCYFCFQVTEPIFFYRRIRRSFENLFAKVLPEVFYDPKQAGFYIGSRKIASLGFRYSQGVSLHGVSVNIDVDLSLHNRVNPCGIEGIAATSLKEEGIEMNMKEMENLILQYLCEGFNETL
jgi:lipoyl(octanoyl) transferase